jgi:chromosomal replication initiator protein
MIDTVVRETWLRIRERLREEMGERLFSMWFERSSIISLKRGVLAIGVPNLFIREWVEEHYGDAVGRVAAEEIGTPVQIAVKVDPDLFREMRRDTARIEDAIDPADAVEGKTLDSFVVTEGADLAVKALRHVASGAPPRLDPLVIFGEGGTGKSHLAAAVSRLFPPKTRMYRVTGEEFARRFAWNLKTRKIERFRDEVGGADVVVLDDAQDLAGKTVTQRELATLLQELQARGGRLVAFMDRHPKEATDLEESLRSVLLSGMLQEILPPSDDEKVTILDRLLTSARRRVPLDLIRTVVQRCNGSVKRLDRLLRKIYAFAGLTGEPVDDTFLDRHLTEIAGPMDPEERRLETILSVVEDHFDITRDALLSKRKTKNLSAPRGLVVYLLREQGGATFKDIGRRLGNRSHTSVYLIYKKYAELIPQDPELRGVVHEAGRRLVSAV